MYNTLKGLDLSMFEKITCSKFKLLLQWYKCVFCVSTMFLNAQKRYKQIMLRKNYFFCDACERTITYVHSLYPYDAKSFEIQANQQQPKCSCKTVRLIFVQKCLNSWCIPSRSVFVEILFFCNVYPNLMRLSDKSFKVIVIIFIFRYPRICVQFILDVIKLKI